MIPAALLCGAVPSSVIENAELLLHSLDCSVASRRTVWSAHRAGSRRFSIEGGFLQVVENQVRVVTERAAVA